MPARIVSVVLMKLRQIAKGDVKMQNQVKRNRNGRRRRGGARWLVIAAVIAIVAGIVQHDPRQRVGNQLAR